MFFSRVILLYSCVSDAPYFVRTQTLCLTLCLSGPFCLCCHFLSLRPILAFHTHNLRLTDCGSGIAIGATILILLDLILLLFVPICEVLGILKYSKGQGDIDAAAAQQRASPLPSYLPFPLFSSLSSYYFSALVLFLSFLSSLISHCFSSFSTDDPTTHTSLSLLTTELRVGRWC